MNDMSNTFPRYRDGTAAGFKGNSTMARENSQEAAEHVSKTLARRHRQMFDAWALYGPAGAIPEQIAEALGLPVHVVRPRAGELVKRGLLFEVGRRMGDMGKPVMAYSIVRPEAQAVAA
ncbi:hypothetical protein [Alteraurantiacibacter buctensis]|uniref:Uncharacterized protein n=1 Tax=Alteraurantiacibacter buctensis TaxID=1503981 RepID=A0A844YXQ6_9SPHN|nr:hypothetical protein [Alteraurantiacibacter buctensis]MXO71740.1 hypothetical protein [Alteraurantiacibacter buctensis]